MGFVEPGCLTQGEEKPFAHARFIHHFYKSTSVLLLLTTNHDLFLFKTTGYLFTGCLVFLHRRQHWRGFPPPPWKVVVTPLLKLPRFTQKVTRFMGLEGETQHSSDPWAQPQALFRPGAEVSEESLAAHTTPSKCYYCCCSECRICDFFRQF